MNTPTGPTGPTIYSIVMKSYLHRSLGGLFPGDNPENIGIAATLEQSIRDGHPARPFLQVLLEECKKRRVRMSVAQIDAFVERAMIGQRQAYESDPIVIWRAEIPDRVYGEWASHKICDYIFTFVVNLDPDLIKIVTSSPSGYTDLGGYSPN